MVRTSLDSLVRRALSLFLLPVFAAALVLVLALATPAAAQKRFEDVTPGRTFPKEGVTPNPKSVVFIIYWHHKSRVQEFGFQDYYQGADDVNPNMAGYIRKAMEKRYPNLVVNFVETNERDVKAKVEQLKNEKRTPIAHVDVPQPKIELPKKVGRRDYSYDGGVTKLGPEIDNPRVPPQFAVVERVNPDGGVILKCVQTHNLTKIMVVEVVRGGQKVKETRNVPFQTYSNAQTGFRLKDEAGLDSSGKTLSKNQVMARLKPGQTVLLASDHRGIDPAYLTILKPDTIILLSGPGPR